MIYLAWVNSPRGPQPQLWFKERPLDHFVTPSDLSLAVKEQMLLPANVQTLDEAVAWAAAQPKKAA